MRKLAFLFCLVFLCRSVSSAVPYAAKVNGAIIPLDTFETALIVAKNTLTAQNSLDPESAEGRFILATTQRSILDDMINQELIHQQAEKMNIQVTTADVTEEIARLRSGFPSQELFEETLAQEHINSEELAAGVRARLVSEKIKKLLARKSAVSDKELSGFLKNNQELFPEEQGDSDEARKYLIRKKENEIFDRWFAKIRSAAKIEINPDLLAGDDLVAPPGDDQPLPDKTISNGRV
ncbi:hypothetical protein NO2_0261 [Candidatus Termititenax persephonae]|uniref:SurA N-terminal domain-containing protein n=1 Tax=Candidatus Termititenax persephonae TaxID=2218525 RepID=A0A388TG43_9BACT|nr:hypothetical protein NO2_0261 [Candidatus Termititenax persephonae]